MLINTSKTKGVSVSDIHRLAVELGIKADPRGNAGVARWLKLTKKQFEKLDAKDKKYFDLGKLTNPYPDSIVHFDSGKTVAKALVGIDIGSAEVLLADRLGADLIIGHHPDGNALANLDEVMHLQADLLNATAGVPINVAEAIIRKRASVVSRKISPANHHQPVDTARLLDISFMSLHTVADNLVWQYVDNLIKANNPETIDELLDTLKTVPEFQEGIKRGEGPRIFVGEGHNRTGKIVASEFTGGTEPGKELYAHLANAGVGTVVGMHMSEDSRQEAEKHHINVVITGHMSSDSLGLNRILEKIEAQGVKIIPCSGLIRV